MTNDLQQSQNIEAETVSSGSFSDIDKLPLTSLEQKSAHWRVVYQERKKLHDVNVRQIIQGQLFTIFAVAAFAVIIEDNQEALLLVGSALIVYPSITDLLVSNVAALSASTHHDYDTTMQRKLIKVVASTLRAVMVATFASCIVGMFAGILGVVLFDAEFWLTFQLAVGTSFLASIIGFPLLIAVTFIARKYKSNPDEVDPPIENVVFNIIVLASIAIISRFIT